MTSTNISGGLQLCQCWCGDSWLSDCFLASVLACLNHQFIPASYECSSFKSSVGLCFSFYFTVMEDACMYEFTPGQITNMAKHVKNFRPTLTKNIYSEYVLDWNRLPFHWVFPVIYIQLFYFTVILPVKSSLNFREPSENSRWNNRDATSMNRTLAHH